MSYCCHQEEDKAHGGTHVNASTQGGTYNFCIDVGGRHGKMDQNGGGHSNVETRVFSELCFNPDWFHTRQTAAGRLHSPESEATKITVHCTNGTVPYLTEVGNHPCVNQMDH